MKLIVTATLLLTMTIVAHASVEFSLLEEDIQDVPVKAQVEQHVLVTGQPTEEQFRGELNRRLQQARQRRGWKHHRETTNAYIYIYGTEEQARAGQGLWVGMAAWTSHSERPADIRINDTRLAALGVDSAAKFGLTEAERKQVFYQVVAAEDRARNEAMRRIPDINWEGQIDLERDLGTRYRAEVLEQWALTDEQAREISMEGINKGWLMP